MGENVTIDKKGRLLFPKKVRDAAGISPPAQAVIIVGGLSRIKLATVNADMKKAKEIARSKLTGWKEEDHEADRMATGLVMRARNYTDIEREATWLELSPKSSRFS